jgi:hypothetical protein
MRHWRKLNFSVLEHIFRFLIKNKKIINSKESYLQSGGKKSKLISRLTFRVWFLKKNRGNIKENL